MPSLADRLITGWYAWLFRRKAKARAAEQTHAFESYRELPVGVDSESDPIDPEAQLCIDCGVFPATYRNRCFGCGARLYIAMRRTPA